MRASPRAHSHTAPLGDAVGRPEYKAEGRGEEGREGLVDTSNVFVATEGNLCILFEPFRDPKAFRVDQNVTKQRALGNFGEPFGFLQRPHRNLGAMLKTLGTIRVKF